MAPLYSSLYCPRFIARRAKGLLALALGPLALLAQQAPDTGANDNNDLVNNIKDRGAPGALRASTLFTDSPVSVTILPKNFIEELGLDEIDDHLAYAAGGNLAGERQDVTGARLPPLRGFKPGVYRNGFQRIGIGDVVNLDRVKIIKGPLATAFGTTRPGGAVNYITQGPLREQGIQAGARFGTFDYQRYEAHINTGSLCADKLFGRVDVAYTDRDGLPDFAWMKRFAASAAVAWRPSKDTVVSIEFERLRLARNDGGEGATMIHPALWVSPVSGTASAPTTGGINAGLGRSGFNPLGPDSIQIDRASTLDIKAGHRVNNFMSMRANFQYNDRPYERWTWSTANSNGSPASYSVATNSFEDRDPYHDKTAADCLRAQIDLLTTFKLGATDHMLLAAMDISDCSSDYRGWKMNAADRANLPSGALSLNAANPDFSGYDRSLLTRPVEHDTLDRTLVGYFLSERMAIGGWALLFASIRYDHVKTQYADYFNPGRAALETVGQPSYSFGGNFKLNGDKIVFFANRSTSFTPSEIRDRGTGELQDNTSASGYEAGFKGALMERRMFWTLSAFRIDHKNAPQRNPLYSEEEFESGVPEYIGVGRERADGLEMEVRATPAPGWTFLLAGSYTDARTREAAPGDEARKGKLLPRVPRRAGSIVVTREFDSGLLRGFKIGASALYTDEYVARPGMAGNQITGRDSITANLRNNYGDMSRIEETRPTAMLYNIFAGYQFDMGRCRHNVGVAVRNVFDKEWWSPSGRKNDGRACFVRYDLKY